MPVTKRLAAIFREIYPCRTLCDIGCDHGLLPLQALKAGVCNRAVLADISEKSLAKAVRAMEREGYASHVARYVTNGFTGIAEPIDQALICGMGGREIIAILSGCCKKPARLILQPMRNVLQVRRYLVANGYEITRDYIVESEGKFYDIIVCLAASVPAALTPQEERYGKTNLREHGEDFMRSIAARIAKNQALLRSSLPEPRRAELAAALAEMEEIAHAAE